MRTRGKTTSAALATATMLALAATAAPSAAAATLMNVRSSPSLAAPVIGTKNVDCHTLQSHEPLRHAPGPSGGTWYAVHGGWVLNGGTAPTWCNVT